MGAIRIIFCKYQRLCWAVLGWGILRRKCCFSAAKCIGWHVQVITETNAPPVTIVYYLQFDFISRTFHFMATLSQIGQSRRQLSSPHLHNKTNNYIYACCIMEIIGERRRGDQQPAAATSRPDLLGAEGWRCWYRLDRHSGRLLCI